MGEGRGEEKLEGEDRGGRWFGLGGVKALSGEKLSCVKLKP